MNKAIENANEIKEDSEHPENLSLTDRFKNTLTNPSTKVLSVGGGVDRPSDFLFKSK